MNKFAQLILEKTGINVLMERFGASVRLRKDVELPARPEIDNKGMRQLKARIGSLGRALECARNRQEELLEGAFSTVVERLRDEHIKELADKNTTFFYDDLTDSSFFIEIIELDGKKDVVVTEVPRGIGMLWQPIPPNTRRSYEV